MKALHGRLLGLPLGDFPFGDQPLLAGDPARPFPGDFPFAQFPFLPPFDEGDLECNGVVNHLPLGECDGVCEGLLFLPPGDIRVPNGDLGDLPLVAPGLGVEGYRVPPGDILVFPPGERLCHLRPPGDLFVGRRVPPGDILVLPPGDLLFPFPLPLPFGRPRNSLTCL